MRRWYYVNTKRVENIVSNSIRRNGKNDVNLMMCSRRDYASEFFPLLDSLYGDGSIPLSLTPIPYFIRIFITSIIHYKRLCACWETEHLC